MNSNDQNTVYEIHTNYIVITTFLKHRAYGFGVSLTFTYLRVLCVTKVRIRQKAFCVHVNQQNCMINLHKYRVHSCDNNISKAHESFQ